MINQSYQKEEILSSNQLFQIQIMREKIVEQDKIILDLTKECDILREWYVNCFNEEIRKEWI